MDLTRYFEAIGVKLSAELAGVRATMSHSGNKGSRTEEAFREFLRDHIPRKHDVGHGEVTDVQGRSAGAMYGPGQIDVLIIDEAHPRFAGPAEPGLYFIEGVLAGGEVKTHLKLGDVDEIVRKAAAFKLLQVTHAEGDAIRAQLEDFERFVNRRPYFLFAYESETTVDSLVTRLNESARSQGISLVQSVDAVFLLDRGAAINVGDGQGSVRGIDGVGNPIRGWVAQQNPVMVDLIAWLHEVMPNITHARSLICRYVGQSEQQARAKLGLLPNAATISPPAAGR